MPNLPRLPIGLLISAAFRILRAADDAYFTRSYRRSATRRASDPIGRGNPQRCDEVTSAAVTLSFSFISGRQVLVKGRVEVTFTAQCQRCLEPVAIKLASDFEFEPEGELDGVSERQPRNAEDTGELWLNPVALVEDEILLAAPMIPKHTPGNCELQDTNAAEGARKPFAQLAALRKLSGEPTPQGATRPSR